ncbi:MAG: FtsX-like permease family protein [Chloroflexi bacterium]|nr:FtsX-like permease family protein [Chloroflexota bacterium]
MLRPRWRKVFSDLIDNKFRTALVVFSIAVGVFSIGVIAGAYVIIANDMSASYSANNPMNVELRMSDPFTSELVTTIQGMRGVAEAEGRRIFAIRVRVPGNTQWTTLDIVGIDDYKKMKVNLLRPIAGEVIPGRKQIILEKKAVAALNVSVGSNLEFELPDGTTRIMPIIGFVQDQSTGAGDFLAPPLAYINTDTLNYMRQPEGFNRMFITLSSGQNDELVLRQIAAKIKDKVEKTDITVSRTRVTKTNEHPMASTVQAILGILLALGVLILFLSSSLIANTLSALLNQHLRHIGVMKLIGGRRNQILEMYIVLIMAFGVIALFIAVPLGGQGAYGLAAFIADKLNFSLLGYRLVPLALGIQIIIGLAVPLLAGLWPVLNGSRITVLRAISGDAAREIEGKPSGSPKGESRWEHFQTQATIFLGKKGIHIPRPLLISLRNTFRRRGRLILTLFTLTMGGAIFIAVFNVRVTLFDYIGAIGNYFKADVTVTFDRPYRLKEVTLTGMQFPGIKQVEGWAFANAEVMSPDGLAADNMLILAPPVDSKLVEPILVSGRWLQPGDQKAVTVSESLLAKLPDLRAGQSLHMKVDGKEDDWKVVGIFKFVSQQGTIGYGTYDYISKLTNLANRSASFRVVADKHDEVSQKLLAENLDRYFRDQGFHVTEVRTGKSTLSAASESLDILVTFLLVMALLTATVGSMGLAGTMGMNVLERTREIGIMRSIGAVDREIMRTVIVEGVVIGSLSWILGAILSFPFTYLLSTIVSLAIFNSPIDVHFTWLGYAIWLMVVLGLSAVASIFPARNAAHLTIREVLAYE